MTDAAELNLDLVPQRLRDQARALFAAGDADLALCCAPPEHGLGLVYANTWRLKRAGTYEIALLRAYAAVPANTRLWPFDLLRNLFLLADRARLLAAGDPIPPGDHFTLYRGVAGLPHERRVAGLSWTDSPEMAQWFADRFGLCGDPAVYRVTVRRADVLAYIGRQRESEYILALSDADEIIRITPEAGAA